MKMLKGLFTKLISGNTNEVSSRRGIALTALILVIMMAVAHTFGQVINPEIYIATVSLVAAAIGFTLYNPKTDR